MTYPWLTATVIPRPIAWVSSRSADRVDNLAPHSYFTAASAEPPVICFTSVGSKDSLCNIQQSREFVVCTPRTWAEPVNLTGTNFPAQARESDAAGRPANPAWR